jgi:hypothetical protein
LLKSIALLPKNSFCPFLPTLSPDLTIPSHSPPTCHQITPSLLHTHHLLTNLQYQFYTTSTPCNPRHKHPPLQKQKYTQTHTRTTKTSSTLTASPNHLPHFPPPLLVPPYPTPQISIASLTNINPSNSHCLKILPPRGLHVTYKLLVGY